MARVEVAVLAFGQDHWLMAWTAFLRYGKGRHPAGLNLGDCLTYAVAKLSGLPLLCIGGDFALRAAAGCVGVVVDALPSRVSFYEELGFVELELAAGQSPIRPRPVAMFLPLAAVEAGLPRGQAS